MLPDETGLRPLISDNANSLGIRPGKDLPVSDDDQVKPCTGGMSVSPTIRALPFHRIPKRMREEYPRAEGNSRLICWKYDDVDWLEGPLTVELSLRLDKPFHGMIEPCDTMTLETYRNALSNTRNHWIAVSWSERVV